MISETLTSVDYHTGGEPFRIVTTLPVPLEGETVAAKRVFAMGDPGVERIRRILCFEPRGHADMYGCFVVEPDDAGAHFGVLFWHKDGFSTACGHGTIALGVWAIESGLVERDASGVTDVVIDVPSGRVTARVHTCGEEVTAVDFLNVPSYLIAREVPVSTSLGELLVDVSFGGAIYAQLDASTVGLTVTPANVQAIIAIGREIKWLLNDSEYARHETDARLSGIYGTIVYESLRVTDDGALHQRNATIFADGELDRSPCGSGTSARIATLVDSGLLGTGVADTGIPNTLVHDSIVGSRFVARVAATTEAAGRHAVLPEVTGMAFRTGEHTFVVDPRDTLVPGFVLR